MKKMKTVVAILGVVAMSLVAMGCKTGKSCSSGSKKSCCGSCGGGHSHY